MMHHPDRFKGKVAVVTGAAQGIGRMVAVNLAKEGGQVALVDRSEVVNETHEEIAAAGADSVAILADLEQYGDACRVMAEAKERFGRIDILINNVGGTIWAKPFAHYEEDQIVAEVRRSLFPTLWCCRAVLPVMLEQKGGTIVNVSSIATRGINRVPYAAAKGGVNAMTASLAFEYAEPGHPGLRHCAGRNRGAAAKGSAKLGGSERAERAREGLVARGGGADEGVEPDEAVRHAGRAGRGDPVLRVRRSLLHHRRDLACRRRRPGLAPISSRAAYPKQASSEQGRR